MKLTPKRKVTEEQFKSNVTHTHPELVEHTLDYEDLQFPTATGKVPAANAPNWEAFTTNTSEYAFGVNEHLDLQAGEIPHSWKLGTQANVHIHFCPKTNQSTGANRFVKFTLSIAFSNPNAVWAETTLTAEYTVATGTLALTHLYLDMGDLTLTNQVIGNEFKVNVKRIAATGGTEYADDVFVTQVGMHFRQDSLGSRQENIK